MADILTFEEQRSLSNWLERSSRLSTAAGRQALVAEIGGDPATFQFDGVSAHDFAVLLVDKLIVRGDREALQRIVILLIQDLPGSESELSPLRMTLARAVENSVLTPSEGEISERHSIQDYDSENEQGTTGEVPTSASAASEVLSGQLPQNQGNQGLAKSSGVVSIQKSADTIGYIFGGVITLSISGLLHCYLDDPYNLGIHVTRDTLCRQ